MRAHLLRNRFRAIESLESRLALSAAPVVTAVEVGSSDWDAAFTDFLVANDLGTKGFAIADGSADQLKTLPWSNLDELSITFDQDVHIDSSDLAVSGVNTTQYQPTSFFYDPQTRTATWSFSQPFDEDRILIDLNADGLDPITNLAGDRLDGEWTDTVSTFSSGNGVEGGDFEFTLVTNPGDADRLGWVDYYDFVFVYYGSGLSTTDPGYNPLYDIDGDGLVDTDDYYAVYAELGGLAPTTDPAGVANNAPQATQDTYLAIDDDTTDHAISLFDLFEDAEDADSALTFSIVSNDNATLFDEAYVDQSTGEMVLNAASSASGRASLSVSATDSSGFATIARITVDVDRTNAAPNLTYFHATAVLDPAFADEWLITGYVQDSDDDPTDMLVQITGVIETRAAVWEDGWFVFVVIVDPAEYGSIYATVTDSHGGSDFDAAYIGFS